MTDTPLPGGAYPSRRSLREQATAAIPSDQADIQLPRREHVPDRTPQVATAQAPTRRSPRQRLAAAAAGASACGLLLAFALPFAASTNPDTAAAAATQQRLFSEETEALPGTLAEISAVAVDSDQPLEYTFRPDVLVNYPFTTSVLLTDPFGYRTAPVEQFHDAQDFAAAEGTPIQVIADGKVTEAEFASDGCGFALTVEHQIDDQTVTSRYCHMQVSSHDYKVGDIVAMGEPAGRVGQTGMSFGAHLHLAIRVNDEAVDPMPFLAKYSRVTR